MDWHLILKKWSRHLWSSVATILQKENNENGKTSMKIEVTRAKYIQSLRNEFLPKAPEGQTKKTKAEEKKPSSSKANEIVVYLHGKVFLSFSSYDNIKYRKFSQFPFETSLRCLEFEK